MQRTPTCSRHIVAPSAPARALMCGRRAFLFSLGDGMFLVLVGAATTAAMQLAHRMGMPMAVALIVGMVLAMMVQSVLALCVAPLLGSLESMVPSMVLAMVAPMTVCVAHAVGRLPSMGEAVVFGAIAGGVEFLWIQHKARLARRAFSVDLETA